MLLQQTTSKVAGDAHLFPVSEYETPTLSASVATSSSKQHLTGICSQRLVSRSVKTHLVTGQAEISVNLNAETSLKVPSDSTTDAHLPPLYIQHLYFLFFLISHILVLLLFDTLRTNLSLGAKLKDYLTILPIFNVLYCSCILLSLQMKSWSTAPSQQHLCLNIIVVDAFMVLTYCWVLCYKQLFTQRPNKKLSIAPIFGSYLFTIMLLQTVAGCDCLKQIILN
ncbi:uncharacterized protein LOC120708167 isoform X1 [Panicum virgatum]|nr:uncharacterized protein LOC120708167 isoform X1 [Panicum virgatum]KAG2568689.1 hypothetical protein PVAP13_7NG404400 [Panicum virgatum]